MESDAQKPKVLVFTTAYAPFIGGAEVAIEQVAKRLSNRFDFIIFTSRVRKDLPKREVRSEGLVVRIGFGTRFDKYLLPIFSPYIVWKLEIGNWKFIESNDSVLWGVDLSFGSLAAAIAKSFWPRTPFIFNIQYGEGEERISKGRLGLMNLAFKLILIQADYVTAISSYLMKLCEKYGYIGEKAVIHNGVDFEKFYAARLENKKISNTIITVSRLVPKNGVDILIQAIVELKKEIPDIKLNIIGDGPERQNVESRIKNLELGENIKLFGEVPHNQIPKYLVKADVFARPSRSEGMGNAFIEALAVGVPIIGTPVGGILDIIRDNETGLFTKVDDPKDLAEKIKILLDDKELAARIVENGKKMILERFDWDVIAKFYARVFSEKLAVKHRILIATGLFPPDVGGPATYSQILLDELPKQARLPDGQGFGVRVLSFGSVRHLPKVLRHIAYGLRLMAYGRNADVIFAQDPISVGLPAVIAAKILRKKFLLKIVGDRAWEEYQQKSEFVDLEKFQINQCDFVTELRKKIERWVARRAEKIIVPSEYLKKILTMWDISPEKIQVIYNAFDFQRDDEPLRWFGQQATLSERSEARKAQRLVGSLGSKELLRAELGLDGKVLVSAGRLVPWKGLDTLIDVVNDLLISYPGIKLVIIGDGPKREALKSQITNHKLQNNVILTGALPREQVLKYLKAADLFVLNTAYEGMSHQILEAMSLGVPVVTTDAGGNPELIKDSESGFLVKFNDKKSLADKISKLLSDSALAQKFSENAQKKAREFSPERMIGEIIMLF